MKARWTLACIPHANQREAMYLHCDHELHKYILRWLFSLLPQRISQAFVLHSEIAALPPRAIGRIRHTIDRQYVYVLCQEWKRQLLNDKEDMRLSWNDSCGSTCFW